MAIKILNKNYDIDIVEIKLINQQLKILPENISNLAALQILNLEYNKLTNLPNSIKKIKEHIYVDESSYDMNNINFENETLIFSWLKSPLINLPINTKEIWLKKEIKHIYIKLPFECVLNYY